MWEVPVEEDAGEQRPVLVLPPGGVRDAGDGGGVQQGAEERQAGGGAVAALIEQARGAEDLNDSSVSAASGVSSDSLILRNRVVQRRARVERVRRVIQRVQPNIAQERPGVRARLGRMMRRLLRRGRVQADRNIPAVLVDDGDDEIMSMENSLSEGEGSDIGSIINMGLQYGEGGAARLHSSPALWIGVGANSAIVHGAKMSPKASAVENIKSGDYAAPVYNDRIQHNLPYAASGVPLMSMMLSEMAETSQPDWRVVGLRVALWDMLREVTTTDLTGVQWASAVNEDHIRFRINTDEVEPWGFQAAFVSLHYIENCLHANRGGVPVGPAGDAGEGETWLLTDPKVRVVVLDSRTNDASLAWAVWTLGHLRYPLTWLLEAALVETDGPQGQGTRDWRLFQNTASLVDQFDQATKVLFVLPTDIQNGVTFGEVDYIVGVAGLRGQIRDRAPVYDADPLIAWMIDTVCNSRTSLKEIMAEYVAGRILNGLDWSVIDGLVGALTARYPPRPEETRGMMGEDENTMNGWWAPVQVFTAYNRGIVPPPGLRARRFKFLLPRQCSDST